VRCGCYTLSGSDCLHKAHTRVCVHTSPHECGTSHSLTVRARARTHTHALEHATLRTHWPGYRGVLAHTRTHFHLRETQATHTPHSRARAQEHDNTTQTLAATAVASSLLSLRVHGGSAPLLSLCFTYGSGVDRWAEFGERSLDLITRSRSHTQHNANSTAGLHSISSIGYVR